MNRTSARLAAIAESATLAVDAKAKALKAKGENVIGFGAGEPDFPTPAHIVEAAERACRSPRFHKYTPAAGLPEAADLAMGAAATRDLDLFHPWLIDAEQAAHIARRLDSGNRSRNGFFTRNSRRDTPASWATSWAVERFDMITRFTNSIYQSIGQIQCRCQEPIFD